MYAAIYTKEDYTSSEVVHITNVSNLQFEFYDRIYDFNNFSAEGYCEDDFSKGLIYVLFNDNGSLYRLDGRVVSGLVKNVKQEGNKRSNRWSFKGEDFRKLFDTEVLIDYSQSTSYSFTVNSIFTKITNLINDTVSDWAVGIFDVEFTIPSDYTTTINIADYTGTYFIKNAYTFLKLYLSYYNYYISSEFDISTYKIKFEFHKITKTVSQTIKLKDFVFTRTSKDISINKTIATIKFDTKGENDTVIPRPTTLSEVKYYLGKDNEIYQGSSPQSVRIYPVKCKIFEAEFLSQAQFNAVYELANNRYLDDIRITINDIETPIDLSELSLADFIGVYDDTGFYKNLPIAEKQIVNKIDDKSIIIKLGFKKMLLTEIIKGGA